MLCYVRWSRESKFATKNTTDTKTGFQIIIKVIIKVQIRVQIIIKVIIKVRAIEENFSLIIEEYLRTATFKPILLLLIKKSVLEFYQGSRSFAISIRRKNGKELKTSSMKSDHGCKENQNPHRLLHSYVLVMEWY